MRLNRLWHSSMHNEPFILITAPSLATWRKSSVLAYLIKIKVITLTFHILVPALWHLFRSQSHSLHRGLGPVPLPKGSDRLLAFISHYPRQGGRIDHYNIPHAKAGNRHGIFSRYSVNVCRSCCRNTLEHTSELESPSLDIAAVGIATHIEFVSWCVDDYRACLAPLCIPRTRRMYGNPGRIMFVIRRYLEYGAGRTKKTKATQHQENEQESPGRLARLS